jgi:hypothetical protein
METTLEIAMIQANTPLHGGFPLYWLLSRNQLEFILQDVTVLQSPSLIATAQYQEAMLPVINLEEHFGFPETAFGKSVKYLVVRAVTAEKALLKAIIRTPHALKMQKLETEFAPSRLLTLPRNNHHLLGIYAMPDGGLGLVPDVAGICNSLK